MTHAEKLALLERAFSTEEGTRAAYRAGKLPVPEHLAATFEERVKDFRRGLCEAPRAGDEHRAVAIDPGGGQDSRQEVHSFLRNGGFSCSADRGSGHLSEGRSSERWVRGRPLMVASIHKPDQPSASEREDFFWKAVKHYGTTDLVVFYSPSNDNDEQGATWNAYDRTFVLNSPTAPVFVRQAVARSAREVLLEAGEESELAFWLVVVVKDGYIAAINVERGGDA